MRQGMLTLSGAPSTTSQIGYYHLSIFWIITSCLYFLIWEVLLAIKRVFLTSWARGTCIFIMHTFIHIFYFNHLGESALLCGQTVPEAIHNQVAIKLLKSGLLTWRIICCVYLFFYILAGFEFKYFLFRDSYLSF